MAKPSFLLLLVLLLLPGARAFQAGPNHPIASVPSRKAVLTLSPSPFRSSSWNRRTSEVCKYASAASSDSVSYNGPAYTFLTGMVGFLVHLPIRFLFPKYKAISRFMLAAFMLRGAMLRLDKPAVDGVLVAIVPPPLPARLCVIASGIVEAVCAALLLFPSFEDLGAKLTVLLLIGVYPSHFYHAFSEKAKKEVKGEVAPQNLLIMRIFFQLLFLYWANWHVASWK